MISYSARFQMPVVLVRVVLMGFSGFNSTEAISFHAAHNAWSGMHNPSQPAENHGTASDSEPLRLPVTVAGCRKIELAPTSSDAIGVAFGSETETDCTQEAFWKSVSE